MRSTRTGLRARGTAAVCTVAMLALLGSALVGSSASASTPSVSITPQRLYSAPPKLPLKVYPAGVYIVELKSAPASTYAGGTSGFPATRPRGGRQLDAHSPNVRSYTAHLAAQQSTLTRRFGVTPLSSFTVAYNGFGAKLTAAQATALSRDPLVLRLTKDRVLKIQDDSVNLKSSLSYLQIAGDSGLWNSIGGHNNAGAGIVVGDIDTGIAPDNASFYGPPLATSTSTTVPWVDDSTHVISYLKADGNTFHSTEVINATAWDQSDYNSKIIGAQYFDLGYLAGNVTALASNDCATASPCEYASPRDADGHGSHTASTAAGDYGVDVVGGTTNFGVISGVAPAAKIAMYKACWSGHFNDAKHTDATGCDEADLVDAIDQAVTDGVDVINFSIGGGAAVTTYSPTDEAFLNAAAAGIFVSAAGGNSGPSATTLDNAAPWETTVAASTIPSYAATATLGNGKSFTGASDTVRGSVDSVSSPPSPNVTAITHAPLVLARNVRASDKSTAVADDCQTGSLSPAKTAGKVVVCDRDGIIARLEMSQTVHDAGGIGMVLVNTHVGDVDVDDHVVPTVHLDQPALAAVRGYAATSGAWVSFSPTADSASAPQVAAFSSRGPVTAAGGDVLKPDIAAPGVGILAAVASTPSGSTWVTHYAFDSGTSMATPHIAGLAALYLGQHPSATPAEIKSALMTTAGNTVDAAGHAVTNPFAQGAGEVKPTAFLNPGLVYDAGVNDWKAYIEGVGEGSFPGVTAIDPIELNEASIALGSFGGMTTVTRTVRALTPGTYTATLSGLAGIGASVQPSTLTFDSVGQTKTFTVTFNRTTAALNAYSTGSLTWTSGALTVRSPIAVKPVAAPTSISGSGTNGHISVPVPFGIASGQALHTYGLASEAISPYDASHPDFSGIFTVASGVDASGFFDPDNGEAFIRRLPAGETYAQFRSETANDADSGSVIVLYLFYSKSSPDPGAFKLIASSQNDSSVQTIAINHPAAGYYVTLEEPVYLTSSDVEFRDIQYVVQNSGGSGHLSTSSSSVPTVRTGSSNFQVRWGALSAGGSYLGLIRYGTGSQYTLVNVDASQATAPESETAPTVSGTFLIGSKLTASSGAWNMPVQYFSPVTYQWLRDGAPIAGATGTTYTPSYAADFGHSISIGVTATYAGMSTVATSAGRAVTITTPKPTPGTSPTQPPR
jgi:subtilisin family serine protease